LYNGEISVAIKTTSISGILSKEECELNMLSEAQTMMNLSHPYLIHFYGISRYDNRLCLVTEYIPNGCLLFWLHQQHQSSVTSHFRRRLGIFSLQICDAMDYLHSKSIIHRDLAARNCLIDDDANLVKVSDFGMAKYKFKKKHINSYLFEYFFRLVSSSSSSSMIYEGRCETPFPLRWSSPEVLLYREYSLKSDVWSYGVLLWEMYSRGQIPFGESISNDFVAQLITSGHMPNKPSLANQLIHRQIISPCWTYKPNDRPSFSALKETLNKIFCVSQTPHSFH
jgi:serine/threonine protein kinase